MKKYWKDELIEALIVAGVPLPNIDQLDQIADSLVISSEMSKPAQSKSPPKHLKEKIGVLLSIRGKII